MSEFVKLQKGMGTERRAVSPKVWGVEPCFRSNPVYRCVIASPGQRTQRDFFFFFFLQNTSCQVLPCTQPSDGSVCSHPLSFSSAPTYPTSGSASATCAHLLFLAQRKYEGTLSLYTWGFFLECRRGGTSFFGCEEAA